MSLILPSLFRSDHELAFTEDIEPTHPRDIPPDEGDELALLTFEPVKYPLTASASGLSAAHRKKARSMISQGAGLLLANRGALHYTQGPLRWQGIDKGYRAWKGQMPRYGDCSSTDTWLAWQGLGHFGVRDTVNGQNWKGGYTGTMLKHGKTVRNRSSWDIGDHLIYGVPGTTGRHTAMYIGGGYVFSHGSEGGPYKVVWNYRSDLMVVKRSI